MFPRAAPAIVAVGGGELPNAFQLQLDTKQSLGQGRGEVAQRRRRRGHARQVEQEALRRGSLSISIAVSGLEEPLQPVDVVLAVLNVDIAHQRAKERQRRLDAVDHEFVERAP